MSKKPTDRPRRIVEDYLIDGEDRDIWLGNLLKKLREPLDIAGIDIEKSDREPRLHKLSGRGSESTIDIELRETKNGIQLGFSNWLSDAELDVWMTAARKAESDTNAGRREFRWSAIVGPNIEITTSYSTPKLAEECMLGAIKLTPSPDRLFEVVPTGSHMTNQRNFMISWPGRASGTVVAHDYWQAAAAAGRELRLLCALLSITFDACWDVRYGPSIEPQEEIEFPQTLEQLVDSGFTAENFQESLELPVPQWLSDAYSTLQEDHELRDSVVAFHEALRLSKKHPSMSMLAFVATIESVGKRNVPLRKCETSDQCTAMVGYGDRVVKSLERVLHKAEIKNLYNIYDLRSRVAHDGSLVGYDRLLGVDRLASLFAADPSHDLELNLWVLMKACRRLLTLELHGPEDWTPSASDAELGLVAAAIGLGPLIASTEEAEQAG